MAYVCHAFIYSLYEELIMRRRDTRTIAMRETRCLQMQSLCCAPCTDSLQHLLLAHAQGFQHRPLHMSSLAWHLHSSIANHVFLIIYQFLFTFFS